MADGAAYPNLDKILIAIGVAVLHRKWFRNKKKDSSESIVLTRSHSTSRWPVLAGKELGIKQTVFINGEMYYDVKRGEDTELILSRDLLKFRASSTAVSTPSSVPSSSKNRAEELYLDKIQFSGSISSLLGQSTSDLDSYQYTSLNSSYLEESSSFGHQIATSKPSISSFQMSPVKSTPFGSHSAISLKSNDSIISPENAKAVATSFRKELRRMSSLSEDAMKEIATSASIKNVESIRKLSLDSDTGHLFLTTNIPITQSLSDVEESLESSVQRERICEIVKFPLLDSSNIKISPVLKFSRRSYDSSMSPSKIFHEHFRLKIQRYLHY
ncbi:hypothetical protein HK096_009296 [Nowakowskiella sp. JEL0078]|nr:hypothetical protein HK096_009296 [Nowakowskiella sp. JEL0078]